VQAIAAQAGLNYSTFGWDYGIDVSLRAVERIGTIIRDTGLQLDLQLKSTTRASVGDTVVSYDLDARSYQHLRVQPPMCPRILVLLVLPDDDEKWLSQSPEELILRHCAYWLSLRGMESVATVSTVRLAIPRSSVFSVQAVRAIMDGLRRGETP
jgi:hypothetical protein